MSKKIIRPINPITGKEYSRSWAYRLRHPDVALAHKISMRSPEALKASSLRTIKNKEKLRIKKLEYYHKNKDRLLAKRKERGVYTKERIHSNYLADYHVPLKSNCEICGDGGKIERHHWNYAKPLQVSSLCRTCHKIQHVKNFPRWNENKLKADALLKGVKI